MPVRVGNMENYTESLIELTKKEETGQFMKMTSFQAQL